MTFYLIRHGKPEIDTTIPSSEWRLSHSGINEIRNFAKSNFPEEIELLISSYEPKAVETAQLISQNLGIPSMIAAGLEEHKRENVQHFPNPEHFERHLRNFFAQPDECVFGTESATQALIRFQTTIASLLSQYSSKTIGFISHGCVISVLISAMESTDGYIEWHRLQMPDLIKIRKSNFNSLINT